MFYNSYIPALEYLLCYMTPTYIFMDICLPEWIVIQIDRDIYRGSNTQSSLPSSLSSCPSPACHAHSDLLVITSWFDPRTDGSAWMHTAAEEQDLYKSLH